MRAPAPPAMPRPLLLALALVVGACGSSGPDRVLFEGAATVAADGPDYTLVALEDPEADGTGAAREVAASDSATTAWDLALRGTEVRLNGGSSGPGGAVGTVVEADYAAVSDALAEAYTYRRDGESPCPAGPPRAVCDGDLFVVAPDAGPVPLEGRTLLLRLGDGQGYAKVVFERYDAATQTHTFSYTVDPEGSSFLPEAE